MQTMTSTPTLAELCHRAAPDTLDAFLHRCLTNRSRGARRAGAIASRVRRERNIA